MISAVILLYTIGILAMAGAADIELNKITIDLEPNFNKLY
jgi:hypothetical protein